MNDQEFAVDMVRRTRTLSQRGITSRAQSPFETFNRFWSDVFGRGISMVRGQPYNHDELTTSLNNVRTSLDTITALINSRQGLSHEVWIARSFDTTDSIHTEEHFLGQLAILHQLVDSGTFVSISLAPGSITVVTTPVSIEYGGDDYMFGAYTIVIQPAEQNGIRLSGGRNVGGFIHPHLGPDGGCMGSGRDPIYAALRNQSWSDVFLLVDQLLRSYNARSPMQDIERWSGSSRCPECNSAVRADADVITINGSQFHRACTTTLFDSPDLRVRLSAAQTCTMCGRSQARGNVLGREGCVSCRDFVRNERQLAQRGIAVCHNCEAQYDSDYQQHVIALSRGDRVCTACTTPGSTGHIGITHSMRWNRTYVIGMVTTVTSGRSILRPLSPMVNRETPAIQVPTYAVCSCGVRQLSHDITPCSALADKTSCQQCDPEGLRLSKAAQDNPFTCLGLVTAWVNQNVHSRLLDFFDFVNPAVVASETMKTTVKNIILHNNGRLQTGPAGRFVTAPVNEHSIGETINHINLVLGYPAIIASNELIGIYDSTYHPAHANA